MPQNRYWQKLEDVYSDWTMLTVFKGERALLTVIM